MAGFRHFYLEAADADGMAYRIGYYKPDGRPGVVSAYQGRARKDNGFDCFQCDMFGCRKFKAQLPGRASQKAIAKAMAAMVIEMKAAGAIFPADADMILAKAQAA
jgi:hypothetical protein